MREAGGIELHRESSMVRSLTPVKTVKTNKNYTTVPGCCAERTAFTMSLVAAVRFVQWRKYKKFAVCLSVRLSACLPIYMADAIAKAAFR